MIAILAAFAVAGVAKVALPTLSAVLIYAAFGSLRFGEMATIFRTGRIPQVAIITTFAATLFLPVATAVGIGVALSLLLQLNREALDLAVVEVVTRPDGRFEERPAPAHVGWFGVDRARTPREPLLRRSAYVRGSAARPRRRRPPRGSVAPAGPD